MSAKDAVNEYISGRKALAEAARCSETQAAGMVARLSHAGWDLVPLEKSGMRRLAEAAVRMYEEAGGEEDDARRSSVEAFREFYAVLAEYDPEKWAKARANFEARWKDVDLSTLDD